MPNAAKATKRYEQRMKDKGFVRKHVWVPVDKGGEVEAVAEKLRRESGEWTEEEFKAERNKLISKLANLEGTVTEFFDIRHITIFGSYAMGDATPASDVDLYVELNPGTERGLSLLSKLQHLLRDLVGRKVDVVFDDIQNPAFSKSIDEDGIKVF